MAVLALATAAYVNLLGPVMEFLFTGRTGAAGALAWLVPASVDLGRLRAALEPQRVLRLLPWILVTVAVVKGVAWFGQYHLMGMASQRIIADLRQALFDHLLRLSPSFFARRRSGDLMSRLGNDVQSVENAVSTAVASYLRDGLTVA